MDTETHPCYACQEPVAMSAEACPHCGAREPAPSWGRLIYQVAGVIAGIVALVYLFLI